ncbi:MAG TPA: choice-of-anchor D domain-containing protein [Kofleriaceae bacterium]
MAVAIVLGAVAASAYAVGNGDVTATPPVTITHVTGGGDSGTATLTNTTSSSIDVELSPDVSCDPDVIVGSDNFTIAGNGMKQVGLPCGAAQPPGIERCLVHATDATTGDALVDLLGVCEDASGTGLVPLPTSLSFGPVAVGNTASLPLALTNASTSPITKLFLQTDDLDGDFVLSAPCNPDAPYCDGAIPAVPPNGSASVLVSCTPRSAGTHTAHLDIATDASQRLSQSVALDCTGVPATGPVLGVTPATVDVAQPVEVTSAQAQTIVRLSNLGAGVLQITDVRVVDVVIGAAEDWTFSVSGTACTVLPCSLAAGAEADLTVTFDPSAIARRDATLLVSFNDGVDRTHSVPLAGIGQGATLAAVGANALDFGDVPVGKSSSLTFQLANRGNRDTTPTLMTSPADAISTSANSITVSPTMLATVTAICAPAASGVGSATITAQSPDGTASVAATCNGTAAPLSAQPTAVALGEVRLGTTPQTLTFTLASSGAPLTFSGQPTLDVPSANLSVGTLSSTVTPATIDVTLDPQAVSGIASRLVVTDTAGDVIHIPISASVVTPQYAAPSLLDVGTFCIGQPTASATATLQNSGTATLELTAPSLPDTSPFQLAFDAPTLYPASLAAADTATIAVTPERQSQVTTITDMLTWTTDDLSQPTATTLLTASFIGSGGAIAPQSLDFGDVPVHVFVADGQRVVIQNCNASALEINRPTPNAPFSIDSPNFPTSLDPNESATFSIGFHPTSLGAFKETLQITSPQLTDPLEISLFGTSVSTTPPPDAGVGPSAPSTTTFYACNAGGAANWPIALVVVALIFRRRRGSS